MSPGAALFLLFLTYLWISKMYPEDSFVIHVSLTLCVWCAGIVALVLIVTPFGLVPLERIISPH